MDSECNATIFPITSHAITCLQSYIAEVSLTHDITPNAATVYGAAKLG